MGYALGNLDALEAEAMHIIREVAAEFDNPVLLYSIGKDSMCMLHVARKAFAPGPVPFPLLHIDTTWNFREMIEFRDHWCAEQGFRVIVHVNEKALAHGMNPFDYPSSVYTPTMNTHALVEALTQHRFDAALGGGRRDEEKSRAKVCRTSRRRRQKYPSRFFFSIEPASSLSIRRPCRSLVRASSISWMISGTVTAVDSCAAVSG